MLTDQNRKPEKERTDKLRRTSDCLRGLPDRYPEWDTEFILIEAYECICTAYELGGFDDPRYASLRQMVRNSLAPHLSPTDRLMVTGDMIDWLKNRDFMISPELAADGYDAREAEEKWFEALRSGEELNPDSQPIDPDTKLFCLLLAHIIDMEADRIDGLPSSSADRTDDTEHDQPATCDSASAAIDEDSTMSARTLATVFGVDHEALRLRLNRWRAKNDNGWVENANRKPREPQYLYRAGAVRHIIEDLKKNGTSTS